MAGDLIDLQGRSETDRLRLALRKAEERIEELEYELAEARGDASSLCAKRPNRVWFLGLTPLEARLMEALCDASPRTVLGENLLAVLYPVERHPGPTMIRVLISKLRAKLGPVGLTVDTVRGQGYGVNRRAADRWRRWCDLTAQGAQPPRDFRIDPSALQAQAGRANYARFCADVRAAASLIDRGMPAEAIADQLGRCVDFVGAIGRDGSADAPCGAPAGRSRDEVVEEAVRLTLAETPVTLPETARRAAGHAVDLMSEEVMAMIAGGME